MVSSNKISLKGLSIRCAWARNHKLERCSDKSCRICAIQDNVKSFLTSKLDEIRKKQFTCYGTEHIKNLRFKHKNEQVIKLSDIEDIFMEEK